MSGYDEASGAEDLSEDGQVRSPDIHEERSVESFCLLSRRVC